MHYKPIESYGVIGNLDTVALVGTDGSIDFMCFPDFDSPTVFASLLDWKKGGKFQIQPATKSTNHKQFYLPDTCILLTRFMCEGSVAEISDFMAIEEMQSPNILVRRMKVVRGRVVFQIHLEPRFDYARSDHSIKKKKGEYLFIPKNKKISPLRLRTELTLQIVDGALIGEVELHAGECLSLILEEVIEGVESPATHPDYVAQSFKNTMNYWHRWISRSNYRGRWREVVNRSALTLKMLTSRKYGSIVAAPTFGLPEEIGGVRNWDYRYTWIRDGSFTLYALIRLGYTEEAGNFMRWIEDRCRDLNPDGSLQVMYGLDGTKKLTETELSHLEGYKGSSPIRIGNGAYGQLQLDIYGELMDSVYLYDKFGDAISIDLWLSLTRLLDWVCKNWKKKGMGIWEVRGRPQKFLYSRLMCWVALDRGIRLGRKRSFPAPYEKWLKIRDTIYKEIITNYWNEKLAAFVQTKNGATLDASSLMMPMMRFIGPKDPRWLSTMEGISNTLLDDSLVHRYDISDAAKDGLSGGEGTFSMCSFWYVECLSRSGDLRQARFVFEKVLAYSNHLGLYAEELGASGNHLGNYPQAFTHLGLISAAFDLDRRMDIQSGHLPTIVRH